MVLVETQALLLEGHAGGSGGVDGQHNKILDMYREIVAMLVDQPDVEAIGRNIRELNGRLRREGAQIQIS